MKGPSSIIFACLISRTHFIARRRHRSRQSQSWSQLRVALPSSRTQICRGAVTSHPAFRFSRRALITGVPGERNERRVKERKKKKKKGREGEKKIVLARLRCSCRCECVHACTFTLRGCIHATDAIAGENTWGCEVRFGECRRR